MQPIFSVLTISRLFKHCPNARTFGRRKVRTGRPTGPKPKCRSSDQNFLGISTLKNVFRIRSVSWLGTKEDSSFINVLRCRSGRALCACIPCMVHLHAPCMYLYKCTYAPEPNRCSVQIFPNRVRNEPNRWVYLQHYHPALYVRAVFLRLYF